MSRVQDNYKNAVVGKVTKVSMRTHREDGYRLVTLDCDESYGRTIVRAWVCNPEYAEAMVDRMVVVYDCEVHPISV